jgi:hypothetical protein
VQALDRRRTEANSRSHRKRDLIIFGVHDPLRSLKSAAVRKSAPIPRFRLPSRPGHPIAAKRTLPVAKVTN